MKKRLEQALEFVIDRSGHLSGWLLVLMVLLVLVEVISRYAMHHPLMIADAVSGHLLVIIAFMGLAYTWRERGHIAIRVVVDRVSPRVAGWLRLVTLILITAFVPLLIKVFFDLTAYLYRTGTRGETTARMPMVWWEMFTVIGLAIFFVVLVIDLVRHIKAMRNGMDITEETKEGGDKV
ncbi:TRAP transporter small permease subunit [Chloroflexota bacterium]